MACVLPFFDVRLERRLAIRIFPCMMEWLESYSLRSLFACLIFVLVITVTMIFRLIEIFLKTISDFFSYVIEFFVQFVARLFIILHIFNSSY